MENYFFMRPALNWLAEPRRINRMLAITLRVLASLIVPFSLVTFFKAGKVIFDLPASGILGGIVFQMFFVLAIYAVVHGLFIRARNIDALPGGEYNMFPLAALLVPKHVAVLDPREWSDYADKIVDIENATYEDGRRDSEDDLKRMATGEGGIAVGAIEAYLNTL